MTSWRRNVFVNLLADTGFNWEDAIAAGNSYLRVHIRWGFHLDAPVGADIQSIVENVCSFGVVTTIGNGSETRPNARTQSGNQAPPTQRWLYWETRAPVVTAIDNAAGIITFRDSGPTELTDTKAEVLATGLPVGTSLNLSTVWALPANFDPNVNTVIWSSTSIMRKN